ncbi:MAG: stage III sporulation protein AC [Clostridia bacterium]|nr:stage III sporulation protein AC [Clostridia bacterium]
MDITLILKVAGVGLLAAAAHQILQKNGRDEQATFVIIAGIVTVMLLLVREIGTLFQTIKSVFGL